MCPGGVFFSKKVHFFGVWPENVKNRVLRRVSVNPSFRQKNQKNTKKRQNFENPTWQKVAKKGGFSR
jgi:hypothetical protein